MCVCKDERGRKYGAYVMTGRAWPNYPNNDTANWFGTCQNCGHTRVFNGNAMRFNRETKTCERCGYKG